MLLRHACLPVPPQPLECPAGWFHSGPRVGAPSIAQEDLALEQIAMRFYLISLIRMVESKETDSNDGNKTLGSTDRLILFVT